MDFKAKTGSLFTLCRGPFIDTVSLDHRNENCVYDHNQNEIRAKLFQLVSFDVFKLLFWLFLDCLIKTWPL